MILDSILAAFGPASDFVNPQAWLTDWSGGPLSGAGGNVSPDSAMALPAYYACVRVISEDVAKLPLITYERLEGGGKDRALEHPNYKLLHDSPNPEMTAMSFREVMTSWAMGYHGGYAEIEADRQGRALALWPIHPTRVTPKRDASGVLFYEVRVADVKKLDGTSMGGTPVPFPAASMLHIHGLGSNGITGFPMSAIGREAIGIGLGQQEYRGEFFRNGAMPGAAYTPPKMVSHDDKKTMRAAWARTFGMGGDRQGLAVLDPGSTLTTFSIDPKKAQMIEAGQYTVEDIARLFRMPPHKIQHLLRATFSNIIEQSLEYVTDTLQPWLVRWEQEIARKLFARSADTRFFAEHLVDGLLRGKPSERAAANQIQLMNGVLTIDEWRAQENRNALDDDLGGKHYILSTLKAVEDEDDEPEEPVPPPFSQPPQPPEEEQDGDQDDDAQDRAATFALFEDTFARIIGKEVKAMRRLATKHAGDATAFGNAVTAFYLRHKGMVAAECGKVADIEAGRIGRVADREAINLSAAVHVAQAMDEIRAAFDGNSIDRELETWAAWPADSAAKLCRIVFEEHDNGSE